MTPALDADTLLEGYDETRKYLEVVEERDVPDGATVPRDELVETVTEWGYDRRTVRDTLGLAVERGDYERADGGVRPVRDEPVEDAEPEENPAKEAGSSEDTASNPRRSATENAALEDADDTVDEARVLDAFETCVRFYHEHADDELPEECDVDAGTPREYFEEVRGWDADTVEEKRLGYAPAGHGHELLDRLMSEGYTREEILGTGLFYDLGTPHFEGRVVFPYFDGDGRPCYAISRTTGHPEDPKANQKYTKAVKTKDYSHVDEPIYGLETLDDETETVLVAEGMPDAITAHELGHAAVSPVTTQFKRKHHDVVLEAVADTGTRVVVVADNDSVDPDLDEEERLEVTQYGEGLKGALRTADFLVKNGVDARVTVPPVVAHHGNDLDDFVHEGWGTVEHLVAGAKPPSQFNAYEDVREDREEKLDRARGTFEKTEGNTSSIYDLRLTDVLGVSAGFRGKNPLGHRGDRESYFVAFDDTVAYDHKRKEAYNPLTALLVEADERTVDSPGGRLSDEEVFTAWQHAKEERYISDDDKIPRRALRHVAASATEWDGTLVEHETADGDTFEGLPTDVYNAALDHVEEDLGLDHGRRRIGDADRDDRRDGSHEALIPDLTDPVDRLKVTGFVDHGTRDLLQEARDRAEEKVVEAITSGDRLILEALPTLGKSRGAVKAAADTDEPVTILTSRKELYDQVEDWGDEFGASVQRLPSFFDECPTASGAHGEEWKERVKELYNAGATGRDIHAYAEPPCQEDGSCPYSHAWDKIDEGETDVLVGHYVHAYVPKARTSRTLVFDEFVEDTFTQTLAGDNFKRAVSAFLDTVTDDRVPFDDFTDLVENRDDDERRARAVEYLTRDETVLCDTERAVHDEDFHAYAPAAVLGLLASEDLGNGWEHAELGRDDAEVVTLDRETTTLYVHDPPILDYSRGVVCLDGTPTPDMWETSLGTRLNHTQVLTEEERREYLTDALNLSIVQTTEFVKPYSSGENVNVGKDTALLEGIARKHDRDVDLITTASARGKYPGEGDTVGIDGVGAAEHYGNLKGSNQFKTSRLGAVIGSRHYGDRFVEKWGALMGEAVERGDEKGTDLSYGETGDKIHRHMTEHETLQATLRFGRDGNGALVYVGTSALPDWVPRTVEAPEAGDVVRRTRSDAERDVLRTLTDEGSQTTRELATAAGVTPRQARRITEKLDEEGLVERERVGDGYEHRATCAAYDAPETGVVCLDEVDADPPETLDDVTLERSDVSRTIVHTWNVRSSTGRDSPPDGRGGEATRETVGDGSNKGAPPPNST